jgi:hypothetical protein
LSREFIYGVHVNLIICNEYFRKRINRLVSEDICFLGYNTVKPVDSKLTFQRNRSLPLSRLNSKLLSACFMLVSCLVYSSTLKIEAACPSETLIDFQLTTRHFISQDRILYNYRCENNKSHTIYLCNGGVCEATTS